jgi:MSHA biogenesis protein MshK
MAHRMKGGKQGSEWVAAALGTLLGAVILPAAQAQGLVDPTQPPAAFAAPDSGAGASPGAPVLQSVMISPSRRAAIIDGVVVRVGDKVGNAVLVSVGESEAVLKSGESTQVLKLYPRVEMQASQPARR